MDKVADSRKIPALHYKQDKEEAYRDYLTRIDRFAKGEPYAIASFYNRTFISKGKDGKDYAETLNAKESGQRFVDLKAQGKIGQIREAFDSDWDLWIRNAAGNYQIMAEKIISLYGGRILETITDHTKIAWKQSEICLFPILTQYTSEYRDGKLFMSGSIHEQKNFIAELIHELIHMNTAEAFESAKLQMRTWSNETTHDVLGFLMASELKKTLGIEIEYHFNPWIKRILENNKLINTMIDLGATSEGYVDLVQKADKLLTEKCFYEFFDLDPPGLDAKRVDTWDEDQRKVVLLYSLILNSNARKMGRNFFNGVEGWNSDKLANKFLENVKSDQMVIIMDTDPVHKGDFDMILSELKRGSRTREWKGKLFDKSSKKYLLADGYLIT